MDFIKEIADNLRVLITLDDDYSEYDEDIDDKLLELLVKKSYLSILAQTNRENLVDGLTVVGQEMLKNSIQELASIRLNKLTREGLSSESFGDYSAVFNQDIPKEILRTIYPFRLMRVW